MKHILIHSLSSFNKNTTANQWCYKSFFIIKNAFNPFLPSTVNKKIQIAACSWINFILFLETSTQFLGFVILICSYFSMSLFYFVILAIQNHCPQAADFLQWQLWINTLIVHKSRAFKDIITEEIKLGTVMKLVYLEIDPKKKLLWTGCKMASNSFHNRHISRFERVSFW